MALVNTANNPNGVLGLGQSAAMDQYVTFGGRTLPPDENAILASFNSLTGVVATVAPLLPLSPAGNDGASITAALQSGDVVLQQGATYNIQTAINLNGLTDRTLDLNGAKLVGKFSGVLTVANSVIFGQAVNAALAPTTCNGTPVVGSNQLVVTLAAGIVAGNSIKVVSAASANLVAVYRVTLVVANTLTLDRPILLPFANLDVVTLLQSVPTRLVIIGRGAVITGDSFAAIDILHAYQCSVVGPIYADVEGGHGPLRGFALDIGSFSSSMSQTYVDGYDHSSNTDFPDFGVAMLGTEQCSVMDSRAGHCNVAGLICLDGYQSRMSRCDGYSCNTALASAAAFGTQAVAATTQGCEDCEFDSISGSQSVFGVAVTNATRCTWRNVRSIGCTTRNLDVGGGATACMDCVFDGVSVGIGTPTTASILVSATVVRPSFFNVRFSGVLGTAACMSLGCPGALRGLIAISSNTTTGTVLVTSGAADDDTVISDVRITLKASAANTIGVNVQNSAGRVFIRNALIALGVASDVGIFQNGICVVEMDDVTVSNPNAVATTVGFIANGATSVTRRKGRINMSATATPFTLVQSDVGTFTTNGAVAVTVPFKDIPDVTGGGVAPVSLTGAKVNTWMIAAAGTPAPDQTIVITLATGFTSTGKNLDTSVRGYKVMD